MIEYLECHDPFQDNDNLGMTYPLVYLKVFQMSKWLKNLEKKSSNVCFSTTGEKVVAQGEEIKVDPHLKLKKLAKRLLCIFMVAAKNLLSCINTTHTVYSMKPNNPKPEEWGWKLLCGNLMPITMNSTLHPKSY